MSPRVTLERPDIFPERSGAEKSGEALSAAILVLHLVVLANTWSSLPDRIPIHFGIDGTPDGWGGKWTLALLAALAIALYTGITIASRYPRIFNYPVHITEQNAAFQYQLARSLLVWVKVHSVALFFVVQWTVIEIARGTGDGLNPAFFLIIASMLIGIVVYILRALKSRVT